MIDCDSAVRAFLAAQPALYALAGTRLYAGVDLPAGYKPADGPALIFSARGGLPDYSSHVLNPSYQFRCFALTNKLARELSQALFDVLNDRRSGSIKMARLENIPTLLNDPAVGWPFMLAFYRFWIGNP